MNKLETAQALRQQQLQDSAAAALRISHKIESGEYPLEDVPCFCGSSDSEVVDHHDRYHIPMTTVICRNCALVRVNPRMTQAAFTEFYNTDYRKLNHPRYFLADITTEEEQQAAQFNLQERKAEQLMKRLVEQAIPAPKVVVDYGCHLGGALAAFKKHLNCEAWGIEIDQKSADYARAQGLNVVSSVEELAEKGVKADLVMMQDVIEHLTDLNDVRKLGQIMAPDAYLYVYTPGLFRANFHGNKQIAHTYYFCANTLNWVMVELGFDPTYIDEDCHSFWLYKGERLRKVTKPAEWVEYQKDEIEGKELRRMPPFSGVCKFTKEELYGNMKEIFSRRLPDLHDLSETQTGAVVMINGGPSINDQVDEIKKLVSAGAKVMTILRMYPWCVDHGIPVDYVVSLDCTEDQAKGFEKKQPGVTYLMASVTKPSFLDLIKDEKVYIFDSRNDPKIQNMRREAGYTICTVVNGGGSVSICSISLAFNLGFRDLHIFGLDLMVRSVDTTHADGIAGKSITIRPMPIMIEGEDIITTGAWLEFANQALDLISVAHQEKMLDDVKIYGTSLINKLWDGEFHDEEADNEASL